jgi:alkylation response protein AidB-like acyl-CoA dehydrogenase
MTQAADPLPPSLQIAADARGLNFWRIDPSVRSVVSRYLDADLLAYLEPQFDRLGELAGGDLDAAARLANEHPPILHARDRFGRDQDWIEYHPAYHEMERIAFADFGIHAMTLRGGVLGWPERLPAAAKYAFHYIFSQAECGFMCPINVTDTTAYVIGRYGSPALKEHIFDRMLSQDLSQMWRGTQWMTEKNGGSDLGASETVAERVGPDERGLDTWRLYGEKWFASHTSAHVALVLARPRGAGPGTKGLALFAVPHYLDDGTRNHFRMVRLKEKLGTRSLASAEIVLDGAIAYLVGDEHRGLAQIMDQVNQSRLSHGIRAAGLMRRCLNEALIVARSRSVFGKRLVDQPLQRRQLMKIMIPTEQALSMAAYTAHIMDVDPAGSLLRILTPLVKFRACRDNVRVASAALEARGGNGYIEDWPNARLLRDSQVGTLWEGTSNINALDVVTRAVARTNGQEALGGALHEMLDTASELPEQYAAELRGLVDRSVDVVAKVAADPAKEEWSRSACSALYNVASAVLLAIEGVEAGRGYGDARRLLLSRQILDHRVRPHDPLDAESTVIDTEMADLLLDTQPIPLERAVALVGSR